MAYTDPIGTFPDKNTFRIEVYYAHPPSLVWRALTEPDAIEAWFMPMEIEGRVGGAVSLQHPGPPPSTSFGVITVFDVGSVLEYRFPDAGREQWPESVLRFELAAEREGCRLVFTQKLAPDVLAREEWLQSQIAGPGTFMPGTCAGWEGFFREGLARALDGQPPPLYDDRDEELMQARIPGYDRLIREQLM